MTLPDPPDLPDHMKLTSYILRCVDSIEDDLVQLMAYPDSDSQDLYLFELAEAKRHIDLARREIERDWYGGRP